MGSYLPKSCFSKILCIFLFVYHYLWLIYNLRIDLTGKRVGKGSMTGSMKETQEMIDVCGKYNITCDIETVMPDEINDALDRLAKNDVKYRFVINIAGKPSSL